MSVLTTQPQLMAAAAEDLAGIQASLAEFNVAVAGPICGVAPAAADEVSAAISKVFELFGQEYQQVVQEVDVFHGAFAQALTAGANAYGQAEAAAQTLLAGGATTGAAPAAPVTLVGNTWGLIMTGSGTPIPPPAYVTKVLNYVNEAFTVIPARAIALVSPEGAQPIYSGIKSLPFDTSVGQGVQILDSAIKSTLAAHSQDSVTVLGYSQSAVISSLEMRNLMNPALNPVPIPADRLGFTLLGNPMNPNGGLFARFAGLTLPSLGLTFPGATPPDTPYPTNIYTLQYDGFADFPRYPLNFLADLNAFLGIQSIHGQYPNINPAALPPGYDIVTLPGSEALTGQGQTNYYMITHPNLPILSPVKAIPIIGGPLASLLEPDMRILVNLGYGDPTTGFSTTPANVPTPFGVLPDVDYLKVGGMLVAGAQEGGNAFAADVRAMVPSPAEAVSSVIHTGQAAATSLLAAASSPGSIIEALQTANSTIVNGFTNATANAYAVLLPTADIANMLITTVPSYDVNLFLDGVLQVADGDVTGGLVYALGAPLAANTALGTLAAGFEVIVLTSAISSILSG